MPCLRQGSASDVESGLGISAKPRSRHRDSFATNASLLNILGLNIDSQASRRDERCMSAGPPLMQLGCSLELVLDSSPWNESYCPRATPVTRLLSIQ